MAVATVEGCSEQTAFKGLPQCVEFRLDRKRRSARSFFGTQRLADVQFDIPTKSRLELAYLSDHRSKRDRQCHVGAAPQISHSGARRSCRPIARPEAFLSATIGMACQRTSRPRVGLLTGGSISSPQRATIRDRSIPTDAERRNWPIDYPRRLSR